jgi:hypothetical protein
MSLKKNNLKLWILLLSILCVTYNCQKDEIQVNSEESKSLPLPIIFNQDDFSSLIPYEHTVDLSNPVRLYSEDLKSIYYEFPVNFTSSFNPNALNKMQLNGNYYSKYKVLATVTEDNKFNFYAIKFLQNVDVSDENLIDSEVTFSNLANFTGMLHIVNKDKKIVFTKTLHDGQLVYVSPFIGDRKSGTSEVQYREAENCITLSIPTYTEWYKVYPDGTMEYVSTQYTGFYNETICIGSAGLPDINPNGYNSAGIYTKKTNNASNEDEEVILIENEFDDDQIFNELTGKAFCLNYWLDQTGNSFVKDLLSKFAGDDSEFDIKITSEDVLISPNTLEEVNGLTFPPLNNVITIKISTNKINLLTALSGARTILHEYIHADIFRKLNTTSTSSEAIDFKTTYEAYSSQHQAMGALYISSMRDALKNFHKNVLAEDYNNYTEFFGEEPSDDFYEALAWLGLKEHNIKAWTDLSIERQQEIEDLTVREGYLTRGVICPD